MEGSGKNAAAAPERSGAGRHGTFGQSTEGISEKCENHVTAEPCLKIAEDVDLSYKYTCRGNMVAVVTDGTAVLGLGDIGSGVGMPRNRKWPKYPI